MTAHRTATLAEKKQILAQHTKDEKVVCYVNGHPIENESDIEFHHIQPFSLDGDTNTFNLAPVCKDHHRRIGILSITEYRTKLEMGDFFKEGSIRKLNDVLMKKVNKNYGQELKYIIEGNIMKIFLDDKIEPVILPLYSCPSTNYKYFYISLPIKYVSNDDDLQPRPIEAKRLWEFYIHFLTHTQLSPAVCRLKDNKILLFDGQHKSAAQIWANRDFIECKVYIDPEIRVLKETNLAAHDKLRQMQFFTSVLINKWADIFKEEWNEFIESKGEKSEKNFLIFLINKGKKRAESLNMIISNIISSVLDDKENKIGDFVTERNRARKNPLSINSLKLTIFKHFATPPPLVIDIEKSDELREFERRNILKLLNILAEETLINKWNPDRNDASHKKVERIYSAGSIKAWSKMLKDIIAVVLRLYDVDEKNKIFLRNIDDKEWDIINGRIQKFFSHKIWTDPSSEIDNNLRINNESLVKSFFTKYELTVEKILS